jgi:spore germination protein
VANLTIYVVRPGDSVYAIALRFGVSMQTIIEDNALSNPDVLVVGQALVIRTGTTVTYRVAPGDTLYAIARSRGVSLSALLAANPQITNPDLIYVGQIINIPVAPPPGRAIDVNGYVLPGISQSVLARTLPYLTFVSIFSYQARPDGTLIPINDTPIIAAARQASVAPLMVITNIEEGNGFSSTLANTLLRDPQAQQTMISEIFRTLAAKGYRGLNIDFEYVYPEDGGAYDAFVQRMSELLHARGYILTTAIAPKLSAQQPGLLYEAHHYPVHGYFADHVILMTYEWGYTYGPPMAVSPIGPVSQVLDYAVTVIPAYKILMGMPNYGYDWTLPYRRGTAARNVSNIEAVELAAARGAAIEFDAEAQAPFFYYYDSAGARHIVYFEDARSVQARLRLVDEYNLGGVSYWTINRFFPQNWLVLSSMYRIRKVTV